MMAVQGEDQGGKRFRIVYFGEPDGSGDVPVAGSASSKGWNPSKGCMFCGFGGKLIHREISDSPQTWALFCPGCMEVVVLRKQWPHPQLDDEVFVKDLEELLPKIADEVLRTAVEKLAERMAEGKAGQA